MDKSQGLELFQTLAPLAALVIIIAVGVILMVYQFQRSLFRQRLKEENLKNEHQQALLSTTIAVQENERQRIARDLHDDLGAQLSVALMQLKQANEMLQKDAAGGPVQVMHELEDHLETALKTTKHVIYELLPPQLLSLGIFKAMRAHVAEIEKTGKLKVELSTASELGEIPWPVQLGLYRILSELLNNTLKHAEASKAFIELAKADRQIQCTYRDNGKGLPDKLEKEKAGLGLQSLKGRASALQGTFHYRNAEAGGFEAQISLPLLMNENG